MVPSAEELRGHIRAGRALVRDHCDRTLRKLPDYAEVVCDGRVVDIGEFFADPVGRVRAEGVMMSNANAADGSSGVAVDDDRRSGWFVAEASAVASLGSEDVEGPWGCSLR